MRTRNLQIFDNYIEGTRLRLRSVRVPETGGVPEVAPDAKAMAREFGAIRPGMPIALISGRKTFKTPSFAWLGIRRTEFKRPAHFWPVLPDAATRM